MFAGYFMATARFGRTTVLAGGRHEATRTRGESAVREVTPAEAERDRRIIAALRTQQRGDSVVLYEESAAAGPGG